MNEVDLLAKQLLLICGQRLKVIMDHSLDLEEKISNLDPFLSAYLYELVSSQRKCNLVMECYFRNPILNSSQSREPMK